MTLSKLAIIGPGLLGGSIALCLRKKNPRTQIAIWARSEEAIEKIRAAGIAEIASTDLKPVVEDANVIVLCVPVGAMTSLAEKIAPLISAPALVTDVGSVKAPVVEALGPLFQGRGKFVGSHPMAGSEQTGIEAAHRRFVRWRGLHRHARRIFRSRSRDRGQRILDASRLPCACSSAQGTR